MVDTDGTGVTFRLVDRRRRLARVQLAQDIVPDGLPFDRVAGEWYLRLDLPPVDRMEYLFELEDHNRKRWTIPDAANPNRAPGAFGEKSVVEFAGYVPPAWLADEPAASSVDERTNGELECTLWSPADLPEDRPAPLLAVHDGPEYDSLGSFTHYLGAMIASRSIPPCRAALLNPIDRNAWYSANPDYAAQLCAVLEKLAPSTATVGVGVSLGGLAMLHAHRTHPGTFDALFLQSGSFFTPELDPQESSFDGFAAVTAFVRETHQVAHDERPVPTVLTCGTVEENLANNKLMAGTLDRLGYQSRLHTKRDAHNFTAWRDALHPHLTELIERVGHAA